ncbi:hypothetical protein NPX79_03100 [Spiroplasma endosymbiont of Anurida maritima]|uniref:hypothetical protein n=1 Tax=Spiroplasma endosymbiont of Anurida maritima TaxID=2967972 RepID=UPI0036D3ED6A
MSKLSNKESNNIKQIQISKIEDKQNILLAKIKNAFLDLSDLRERAQANVRAVFEDHEDISEQIKLIQKEVDELKYKFKIEELNLYLVLLEIKGLLNQLISELNLTKHIIVLYKEKKINKKR